MAEEEIHLSDEEVASLGKQFVADCLDGWEGMSLAEDAESYAWSESAHPRDDDGEFAPKDGPRKKKGPARHPDLSGATTRPKAVPSAEAAGTERPVALVTHSDLSKQFRESNEGDRDTQGIRTGPPPRLDMKSFAADLRREVEETVQRTSVSAPLTKVYATVGQKYGLSKHEFLRALYALHENGHTQIKWWAGLLLDHPDPELAPIVRGGIGAWLKPGAGVKYQDAPPRTRRVRTIERDALGLPTRITEEEIPVAYVADDKGHEHAPKGPPVGGQFVSKGGGGEGESGGKGDGAADGVKLAAKHPEVTPARRDLADLHGRISQPDGGFTYQPKSGRQPKTGFALSPYPDRSFAKPAAELKPVDILRYARKNKDLLGKDNHLIGAWHDPGTGRVFLDVSVVEDDEAKARALALSSDQIAYFDLARGASVTVNREATSGGVG